MTHKIKSIHYLEMVMPESIKLFRSTKNEMIRDKYDKNIPHLEIS